MPGHIRDTDIATVRDRSSIVEVIGEYVPLRSAGGGSMKGLCPFHEEKSPSFNVNPSRGYYHCLAGETRVLTWEGVRPIRDLAGGVHRVLTSRGTWTDAPFRSYGKQRLMRVELARNGQRKTIWATDEHRWFERVGRDRKRRREVLTRDLKPGQPLVTVLRRNDIAAARAHIGVGQSASGGVAVLDRPRLGTDQAESPDDWVVDSVLQTDRVEEVFCAEVEEGHAFVLEDNLLTGNCFGCGVGGDVIAFVQAIESLSFPESVERLADRAHIQLQYENAGSAPVRQTGQRSRLIAAHAAAQEFYAEQLTGPDGVAARDFLSERGFDADVARTYGCGYAPRGWDQLTKHLRGKGFSDKELTTAGLAREGQRGMIDRFLGRLLWPIRDITSDVVGFGARRIHDDDRIEAKYLNTPETPIYKKSQLLYGVDLAKKEIARRRQAVVVEGYTDVMACHLAGVPTAVATCGTAFGSDHIKVLRRLLMDDSEFRGEVVFTFDGDAAGQKAALRAFEDDQRFVSQTFVAIEPSGQDPCELRLSGGDTAVRDLVARRQPLFEFAIRTTLDRHNLETNEGRLAALDAVAPIVARIRDVGLRQRYALNVDRWLGLMDEKFVLQRVREHSAGKPATAVRAAEVVAAPVPAGPARPNAADHDLYVQREALKVALQVPQLAGPLFDALDESIWTDPAYVALRQSVGKAGGAASAVDGAQWPTRVTEQCSTDVLRSLVAELAVEPLRTQEIDTRYVRAVLARVQEQAVDRQLATLKSRLQRLNPVEHADDYAAMFGELVALEAYRRGLREQAVGEL